jgi:hypothetical protein
MENFGLLRGPSTPPCPANRPLCQKAGVLATEAPTAAVEAAPPRPQPPPPPPRLHPQPPARPWNGSRRLPNCRCFRPSHLHRDSSRHPSCCPLRPSWLTSCLPPGEPQRTPGRTSRPRACRRCSSCRWSSASAPDWSGRCRCRRFRFLRGPRSCRRTARRGWSNHRAPSLRRNHRCLMAIGVGDGGPAARRADAGAQIVGGAAIVVRGIPGVDVDCPKSRSTSLSLLARRKNMRRIFRAALTPPA